MHSTSDSLSSLAINIVAIFCNASQVVTGSEAEMEMRGEEGEGRGSERKEGGGRGKEKNDQIYSHDVHMYVSVSLERHTYFSTCIIGSACLQDTYGSQD